jgi:methionine-rich copper-binding protein CopC
MRKLLTLVPLVLIALAPIAAQAHAFLDHASPLVGSTVPAAPHEVALTFSQNLEPAFSTAQVTDSSGARVDEGKAQVSGNTMTVGLKALGPGSYKVHWHALSIDTHASEGTFTFHVGGH